MPLIFMMIKTTTTAMASMAKMPTPMPTLKMPVTTEQLVKERIRIESRAIDGNLVFMGVGFYFIY